MSMFLRIGVAILAVSLLAGVATTASAWLSHDNGPGLDVVKTVDSFFTFRERTDPADPATANDNIGFAMTGQISVTNTSDSVAIFEGCTDVLVLENGGSSNVYPSENGLTHLAALEPYTLQDGVFIWPDCPGYQLGPGQTATFGYAVKVPCRSIDGEFTKVKNLIAIEVEGWPAPFHDSTEWQNFSDLHHPCIPSGSQVCLLVGDEDFLDETFSTVKAAANAHTEDPDQLVNDQGMRPRIDPGHVGEMVAVDTETGNPWLLWNTIAFANEEALLPSGQVKDEGLYALPEGTPWSLEDFAYGVVPQDELDKIEGVMPLRNEDLRRLVGQTCIVVLYDSDIGLNYKPINANLQGGRNGLFLMTVEGLRNPGTTPDSKSDTDLLDLWVTVEPVNALDLLPALTRFDVPIQNEEPDSVSIEAVKFESGVLTVFAKSSAQNDPAPPTLNVSVPDLAGGPDFHEMILGDMELDLDEDRYEFTFGGLPDLTGQVVTVTSSLGGAYDKTIE